MTDIVRLTIDDTVRGHTVLPHGERQATKSERRFMRRMRGHYLHDIRLWLRQHHLFFEPVFIRITTPDGISYAVDYEFDDPRMAVLFKLRWT